MTYSLNGIKNFLHWRKSWIELIKYQIGSSMHNKSNPIHRLHVSNLYILKCNAPKHVKTNKGLDECPRLLNKKWAALKMQIALIHTHNRDLLLVNRINEIQSNLTIQGSMQTKAANMDNLWTDTTMLRCKRITKSSLDLRSTTIITKDVLFNGLLLKSILIKLKKNLIFILFIHRCAF